MSMSMSTTTTTRTTTKTTRIFTRTTRIRWPTCICMNTPGRATTTYTTGTLRRASRATRTTPGSTCLECPTILPSTRTPASPTSSPTRNTHPEKTEDQSTQSDVDHSGTEETINEGNLELKQDSNPPNRQPPPNSPTTSSEQSTNEGSHSEVPDSVAPVGVAPATVAPSKEAMKRKEVLKEILLTEKQYVNDLQILVDVFRTPLEKILEPQQISLIFANVSSILGIHKSLLDDLDKVIPDPDVIDFNTKIGDVFYKMHHWLRLYTSYIKGYEKSLEILAEEKEQNKQLAKFLEEKEKAPECKGLNLGDYLIKPVQRMCKYPLLFRELLDATPPDHSDFNNVKLTKRSFESVTEDENKKSAEDSNFLKVVEFNETVQGYTATFEDWFLHDEFLTEKVMNKKFHVYILSRSIIITKSKMTRRLPKIGDPKKKNESFVAHLEIDKTEFKTTPQEMDFTLASAGKSYCFQCPSNAIKLAFKNNFTKASEHANKPRSHVVHVTTLTTTEEEEKPEEKKQRKKPKRSATERERSKTVSQKAPETPDLKKPKPKVEEKKPALVQSNSEEAAYVSPREERHTQKFRDHLAQQLDNNRPQPKALSRSTNNSPDGSPSSSPRRKNLPTTASTPLAPIPITPSRGISARGAQISVPSAPAQTPSPTPNRPPSKSISVGKTNFLQKTRNPNEALVTGKIKDLSRFLAQIKDSASNSANEAHLKGNYEAMTKVLQNLLSCHELELDLNPYQVQTLPESDKTTENLKKIINVLIKNTSDILELIKTNVHKLSNDRFLIVKDLLERILHLLKETK
uniref:DH domain-containing protein n=1 Tax=Arcella intermedia TaxID=1963864 RepID=A0A6B2KY98_9EUKA